MRRLNKREQAIFVICVLLLSIFVIFNGFMKPLQAKKGFVEEKIAAQKIRLTKNMKAIKEGSALSETYNAYINQYKQAQSNEQVMSALLAEIEEVARELGLNISDLKPNKVRKGEYYNQFSVSVTLDNQFEQIMNLLYTLQSAPHLFDVDEARFDKSSNRNEANLRANIVFSKILIP